MDLDDRKDEADPFVVRDLWPTSALLDFSSGSLFAPPSLDDVPERLVQEQKASDAFTTHLNIAGDANGLLSPADVLQLPALNHIQIDQIASLPSGTNGEHQDDDLWSLHKDLLETEEPSKHITWEAFNQPTTAPIASVTPRPMFLSEAGDRALDAAFAHRAKCEDVAAPTVVRAGPLLNALRALGLGRSSLIFPFEHGKLVSAIDKAAVSGHSLEASSSLIEAFLSLGNAFLDLRHFAEKACSSTATAPSTVALARAIDETLDGLEEHVTKAQRQEMGFIGLQQLYSRPREVVDALANLVENIETQGIQNDQHHVLAAVLDCAQCKESEPFYLQAIFRDILKRVGQPIIEAMCRDLGVADKLPATLEQEDDPFPDSEALSRLLSSADRQQANRTRLCVEFVQRDMPDHPAAQPSQFGIRAPPAEWCLEWEDIARVEHNAHAFEQSLLDAIRKYSDRPGDNIVSDRTTVKTPRHAQDEDVFLWEVDEGLLQESIRELDSELETPRPDGQRTTASTVMEACSASSPPHPGSPFDWPPIGLTPSVSISPMLTVQHRIFSYLTLHSIIHRHELHLHLQVHRTFSLFSSGTFANRLNRVLFSLDTQSSARQRGVFRTGGTMGLNLASGKRRAWPPASSEIRLALMDILNECWIINGQSEAQSNTHGRLKGSGPPVDQQSQDVFRPSSNSLLMSLPGNLSFAIRTIPEEEIPRILDPHGLHALDFLKLSYTPPPSLAAVFTPESLDNYDRVFAMLLRLLRIQFVVFNQTPLDLRLLTRHHSPDLDILRRLQHSSTHLVANLVEHFTLYGIDAPWLHLQRRVAALAAAVASPVPPDVERSPVGRSLAEIALLHERTTSRIAGNLLVRRRQRKAADALEAVLGVVLSLARSVRERVEAREEVAVKDAVERPPSSKSDEDAVREFEYEDQEPASERSPERLQERFDAHLAAFFSECAKLARKVRLGEDAEGDDGARSAAQLLSRLDGTNGWVGKLLGEDIHFG